MSMAINSINSLQNAYTNRINYAEQRNTTALGTGTRHHEIAAQDIARYGAYERMGSVLDRRYTPGRNGEVPGSQALTNENLQRIRALYAQAQNADLTTAERLRIHEEITGLIQSMDNMTRYGYPTAGVNAIAELNAAASRNHPASMDFNNAISENRYRILNQYQTVMQLMKPTNVQEQVNTLI